MASGHPECDGLIAVGRTDQFRDLVEFTACGRAAMSIHWSDADRMPNQAWTGDEKRFQPVAGQGASGPELVSELSVHGVGFFDVSASASSCPNRKLEGALHRKSAVRG